MRKMEQALRPEDSPVQESHVQAVFLGTRLDTRDLELGETLALNPLMVRAGARGHAILFRYGAAVLVDLEAAERAAFLHHLRPFVSEAFEQPETEDLTLTLTADHGEGVDAEGALRLRDFGGERLQVVAHVLAKSVVLAHYEERVAAVFDRIERLVEQMRRGKFRSAAGRDLLQQISDVLVAQTQTVGRVEVTEKPEITWDHPDLDRLYERLSIEYELRERDLALTRKLDFISQTAQTYLDMLRTGQSLRVEWYIVLLILVEITLFVYELFLA
jgi:uncharacterized Rmd1/YagE family protein